MATSPATNKSVSELSWTITGASQETRDKVKKAASAEGMTIRAWVDKTLNEAADGKSGTKAAPAAASNCRTGFKA
jgi:hypothetical protein